MGGSGKRRLHYEKCRAERLVRKATRSHWHQIRKIIVCEWRKIKGGSYWRLEDLLGDCCSSHEEKNKDLSKWLVGEGFYSWVIHFILPQLFTVDFWAGALSFTETENLGGGGGDWKRGWVYCSHPEFKTPKGHPNSALPETVRCMEVEPRDNLGAMSTSEVIEAIGVDEVTSALST